VATSPSPPTWHCEDGKSCIIRPAMGRFYLGHLLTVPVYASPEALLLVIYVALVANGDPSVILILLPAMLSALLIHELSHAVVAKLTGMYGVCITLLALGGVCSYGGTRQPGKELLIGMAGPLSNLLTAGVLVAFPALGAGIPVLGTYLLYLFWVSVCFGVFNLIPVYPLDGGQMVLNILRLIRRNEPANRSLTWSISVVSACAAAVVGVHYLGSGAIFPICILGFMLMSAHRDLR
jgi:Zn-dependent protease